MFPPVEFPLEEFKVKQKGCPIGHLPLNQNQTNPQFIQWKQPFFSRFCHSLMLPVSYRDLESLDPVTPMPGQKAGYLFHRDRNGEWSRQYFYILPRGMLMQFAKGKVQLTVICSGEVTHMHDARILTATFFDFNDRLFSWDPLAHLESTGYSNCQPEPDTSPDNQHGLSRLCVWDLLNRSLFNVSNTNGSLHDELGMHEKVMHVEKKKEDNTKQNNKPRQPTEQPHVITIN